MPLDRAHVTAASRITLPLYPITYATVGLLFLLQSPIRTSGQAFDVAKVIAPIPVWGVVFLAVAGLEVLALVTRVRKLYLWALSVGAALATFWAVALYASAWTGDTASFTSSVWVAFVAVAHMASARSLAVREAT